MKDKLRVNDPCPCGSGKKYKKCHPGKYDKRGKRIPPPGVMEAAKRFRELPRESFERGGFLTGRPFIDTVHQGFRIRAVGNRVYKRPLRETFHEFLLETMADTLGRAWLTRELEKSAHEQHILARWYAEIGNAMTVPETMPQNPAVFRVKKSGNIQSLLAIAYDLYSLAHCSAEILPKLKSRLKKMNSFQGARYEMAMGGIAVRAGFDIEWINKKHKHVEFFGRHKRTGDCATFEAKSHHREGVFGTKADAPFEPEKARIKIMDHIREALEQSSKEVPLIIFDDLNLPLSTEPMEEKRCFRAVDEALEKYGFLDKWKDTNFGALFVTWFQEFNATSLLKASSGL